MSIDDIVSRVDTILQMAVGEGKPFQTREVEKRYENMVGENLAKALRPFSISTDVFLSQYPHKFERVGRDLWSGKVTNASRSVIDDMKASKGRKGNSAPMRGRGGFRTAGRGNRMGVGGGGGGFGNSGGAIPRVNGHGGGGGGGFNSYSHSTRGGSFNNGFSKSQRGFSNPPPMQTGLNPSSSSRFNGSDSRDSFDTYRERPRERTRSPPYTSSNNYNRNNNYDRDDDRRRPSTNYDDRNGDFGQYQADPPPSRPKSVFGRQDENDSFYSRRSGRSRERDHDRPFQNSSSFGNQSDYDDDYNDRELHRSRSSRSMYQQEPSLQRARSKSRSMRDVRVSRSDNDSLAARFGELPMTNDRANNLLFDSGVDNEPIAFEPPTSAPHRNTKQNVAAAIVEIFEENNLKSLKVVELIQMLNKRGMDLPIARYGDVGSLKRIKETKQRTLRLMRIDENESVVYYGEEKIFEPTSSNSSTRRADSELGKRGTSIIEQMEMIVDKSMTVKTAFQRIKFDTNDEDDKLRQIVLAILDQKKPKVFDLDRLDDSGTIIRIKHEEVTSQGEIVISDNITEPQKFHAKLIHPWSKPTEFEKVPAKFPIDVVKFSTFNGNFYVRRVDEHEKFEEMQRKIQIIAEQFVKKREFMCRSSDWRKNDGCLVLCQVSNDEQCVREWHRAIFDKVDEEDDLLVVNLIDVGLKKSVIIENVIPMPTSISTIDPFAIKCCLPQFTITDDESFEEIERHWKEEFETRSSAMDMFAETVRCHTAQEGLVIWIKNRNKTGKYFDILQSLANEELIEITD